MANKRSKKVPKTLIVILSILFCLCVGVDGWYYYIWKFAPDKIVSNTYELGLQTTVNDDTKYFIELDYMSNANKNGLEKLDIKFNYMLDEKQEAFYSQGLQYVANSVDDNISFEYCADASQTKGIYLNTTPGWFSGGDNWAWWGSYRVNKDATMYNYASGDDYKTTTLSTNPLSLETKFKIQIGDDLFLMKFRNEDTEMTSENFQYQVPGGYHYYVVYGRKDYNWYYAYYDYSYFAKLMYEVAKSITPGTNKPIVFEFGDLFDYYIYDAEKGQYSDTRYENCDSVIQYMQSYYSIKVNVSENGAQKASDSIFNSLHGSNTYNLLGDYSSDDYFIGRTVITTSIYDFDFVNIVDNRYAIKLRDEFVSYYSQFSKIYLNVEIDLDRLKELNIEFVGLTEDNNLDKFKIHEVYTIQTTENGQKIKTEVAYA